MKSTPVLLSLAFATALAARTAPLDSAANPIGMVFVRIPPGEFRMGRPDPECPPDDPATGENEYEACLDAVQVDERPFHEVRISRGFWMGKYETTQAEWSAVMGSNPSGFTAERLGGDPSRRPVENVTWNEVLEFMKRLDRLDRGFRHRLPSEAEWEYACRAGATGDFYGRPRDALMWYDRNSGHKTHCVGETRPNAWGLCDMLGNVWEWCQDRYGMHYYAESPADDPRGPERGERRVLRGGCIYDWSEQCRMPFRCSGLPDDKCDTVGFRVVRTER
jgi:formylglycine-generating enzyme required for sulfatase activity